MSKFIAEVTINGNAVHHDGNFGKSQIEALGISATSLTGLATVATSGSYNDLINKPALGVSATEAQAIAVAMAIALG